MSSLWRLTSALPCRRLPVVLPASSTRPWRRCLHGPEPPKDEFTAVAEYPEIPQHRSPFEKEYNALVAKVASLKTVEERLWWLNKPKYFGWHSAVLEPTAIPVGALDFVKCVTCTDTVEGLPERFNRPELDSEAARLAEKVAPRLKRYLRSDRSLLEFGDTVNNDRELWHEKSARPLPDYFHEPQENKVKTLCRDIHRNIYLSLLAELPHLKQSKVFYDVSTQSFWFKSNFKPEPRQIYRRLRQQERVI